MTDKCFAEAVKEHGSNSLIGDFWAFLVQTKKIWLVPIILVLLLFGALAMLSASPAAPFIYTLF